MPVKIILYAEDMVKGTELIRAALAAGAALGEYNEVEPPIKVKVPRVLKRGTVKDQRKAGTIPTRKRSKVRRASPNQKYMLNERKASKAPSGSVQGRAYAILLKTPRERTQRQMFAHLKRKGLKPGSAKTAVMAFREQRILIPVHE